MWGTPWKQEDQTAFSTKAPNLPKTYLFLGILLLIFALAASGMAFYFYSKSSNVQDTVKSAGMDEELIKEISKLIVLPEDEQPTIATVADPEQLKDQPFFARAQKGFKVLIYTNAKKAILYDPVNHKIVEVAPLNIGESAGTNIANPPIVPPLP
ncbi:MAG: hypothetical protein Q8R08_01550 [bacterium]|nr:hypothetical protein [bacterium]